MSVWFFVGDKERRFDRFLVGREWSNGRGGKVEGRGGMEGGGGEEGFIFERGFEDSKASESFKSIDD